MRTQHASFCTTRRGQPSKPGPLSKVHPVKLPGAAKLHKSHTRTKEVPNVLATRVLPDKECGACKRPPPPMKNANKTDTPQPVLPGFKTATTNIGQSLDARRPNSNFVETDRAAPAKSNWKRLASKMFCGCCPTPSSST